MKLSSTVMNAMRGLGGAVLIATVAGGCAANAPPKVVQPQPIVVADRDTTTIESDDGTGDEHETVVTDVQVVSDHDMVPAPCGRG